MLYFSEAVFKILLKSRLLPFFVILFSAGNLYGYTAVVKSSKLNMRSSPKRWAKVVAVLEKGDKTEIIGSVDGKWVKVDFNGKKGFLRNRPVYITITNEEKRTRSQTDVKKEKKKIEKKIEKEKQQLEKYRKKADRILSGLEEIDKAVNNAEKRLGSLKKDYFDINNKIRNQKKKIKNIEKELKELQPFFDKRVVSLYKLSRVGQMNLLFSADSVVDFMKRQKALKKIISSDIELIEKYAGLRKEYTSLKQNLINEKTRVEDLQKKISKYLRIKESEKSKKKLILKEVREKENIKKALISSLKKSARKLDEKIKELREAEKVEVSTEFRSFESYKGLLNFPVKGKVVSRFGEGRLAGSSVYSHKSGIDIQADLGEPVHTVFTGEVVFSDWFKGYGNMIIINHGKNYYTIYAHVQEFFKQKGDSVRRDEVIATIGETGSIAGPVLHFEVRHRGNPLNPLKWIKN